MKLDSRILECKKPLTCFDIEKAKLFEGKKGYFSHCIDDFAYLKNTVFGILGSIEEASRESFGCTEETNDNYYYEFFLPAEWVKEPKFMPYTLDTWEQDFKPGDTVVFRDKEDATEYKFVYSGYIKHPNNLISVSFGPYLYTFYDLFNSYEIYKNGNWEPFGRKTKEGE